MTLTPEQQQDLERILALDEKRTQGTWEWLHKFGEMIFSSPMAGGCRLFNSRNIQEHDANFITACVAAMPAIRTLAAENAALVSKLADAGGAVQDVAKTLELINDWGGYKYRQGLDDGRGMIGSGLRFGILAAKSKQDLIGHLSAAPQAPATEKVLTAIGYKTEE